MLSLLLCPFCGTGGKTSILVLGTFFVLAGLGFLFLFIWFLATKQWKETNKLSNAPLEAEKWAEKKKA